MRFLLHGERKSEGSCIKDFLTMATRKFSASEVLNMLADGDSEELGAFSQRELDDESG